VSISKLHKEEACMPALHTDDKTGPGKTGPSVFISYSWTPPGNMDKVRALAERLMRDGVNVTIDYKELKPGQDKFYFMEQMVRDETIHKVLIACNRDYAEKADGRRGGVGDETTVITSEMYGKALQERFIPMVFERDASNDGEPFLPTYLKTRMYIDFSDNRADAGYEELLRVVGGSGGRSDSAVVTKPNDMTLTLSRDEDGRLVVDNEMRRLLLEWSVDKSKWKINVEINDTRIAILSGIMNQFAQKLKTDGNLSLADEQQYRGSYQLHKTLAYENELAVKAVSFFLKDEYFCGYAKLNSTDAYIDMISSIVTRAMRDKWMGVAPSLSVDCYVRANPKRGISRDYHFVVHSDAPGSLLCDRICIHGSMLDLGYDFICNDAAPSFYVFLAVNAIHNRAFFDDNEELQNMFNYQIGLH